MQDSNPDGPANHTGSNISVAAYTVETETGKQERENNDK